MPMGLWLPTVRVCARVHLRVRVAQAHHGVIVQVDRCVTHVDRLSRLLLEAGDHRACCSRGALSGWEVPLREESFWATFRPAFLLP